ncbi:Hypothetical protein MLTONO_p0155 (plasmid) [Mesorhizobium loti]|nr:Hypothetical protein MLTONO_p0155 [Mesorhizobium loti]
MPKTGQNGQTTALVGTTLGHLGQRFVPTARAMSLLVPRQQTLLLQLESPQAFGLRKASVQTLA